MRALLSIGVVATFGVTFGVTFGASTRVLAAPPLEVDCPVLDAEARASLEARAHAEVLLAPLPAGTATVRCEGYVARVSWSPAAGVARDLSVDFAADPAAAVDTLLIAIHALRTGETPPFVPVLEPSVSAPPAPAGSSSTPDLGAESRALSAPQSEAQASAFRVGALVAVNGELWQGGIAGAVAGEAGLRLASAEGWSLAVAGGFGRGVETREAIEAQTWSARLSAGYSPTRWLEVELGVAWRAFIFRRIPGDIPLAGIVLTGSDAEQRGSSFGGVLDVKYVLSRGAFGLALGPQVGLLARPIIVTVGGGETLRVPRLLVGLSLSGTADFLRY